MKTIKIKSIELVNFKGAKSLKIDFNGEDKNIFGDNATFKTTIFDAFTWCLFGKNSSDQTDFGIKTYDKNGVGIPKLEHEVTTILDVDGVETELKRVFKEKWVKQRGTLEATFTGNETLYYWNGVPMKKNEYKQKIELIISENLFKLITNPMYFNSLHWEKQRAILESLIDVIDDYDVAGSNKDFQELLNNLNGVTIEERKAEIASKRKKLNDDIKMIPTRVDEATRNMPESIDFDAVKKEISAKELEIKKIEETIIYKNSGLTAIRTAESENTTAIHKIKEKMSEVKFSEQQKLNAENNSNDSILTAKKKKIKEWKETLSTTERRIASLKTEITTAENTRETKRKEWHAENEKEIVFDNDKFVCPTCKRELEEDDIIKQKEQMIVSFNQNKTINLTSINKKGVEANENVLRLTKTLAEKQIAQKQTLDAIDKLEKEIEKLESTPRESVSIDFILAKHAEYQKLEAKKITLEAKTFDIPTIDTSELENNKKTLKTAVDELKKTLSNEDVIANAKKRIKQLLDSEQDLAIQISELEKTQFVIQNFIKAKTTKIEAEVNSKFDLVSFKMFETQINGSEIPTCKAIVNGVPFNDLNNAMKINCGIDIINTLSKENNVVAPIFIDNAESINQIIETPSQLIKLIVSKDKKLKIV